MNLIEFLAEVLATLTEAFIYVCAAAKLSGQKYTGRQWYYRAAMGAALYAGLVTLMNQIETFSFATVLVAAIFLTLWGKVTSQGSVLINLTSTMITMLVMNAIDFFTFFAAGLLSENPVMDSRSFMLLMTPGIVRYFYLAADKGIQLLLYFCVRRRLPDLRRLSVKYALILLAVTSVSFVLMSSLLSMVLSESILIMQTAILFTFLFAVGCVIIALIALFLSLRYQNEKEHNRLLSVVNSLSDENYRKIAESQRTFAKANHDFRHHLIVIRDLAAQKDHEKISEYTDSLLTTAYRSLPVCQSGNSVIDAIINCKFSEAKSEQIQFTYEISLHPNFPIPSVDICAVLANQLDNALDACRRDQGSSQKYVRVHIWQQTDHIVIFQVRNSISENPFNAEGGLPSTKPDALHVHGLGIRSIQDTAEKYGGTLGNQFQNGEFTSTVYLNLPPKAAKALIFDKEK